MKEQKIKRYRLGISLTFPMTHPRKMEKTDFMLKILSALGRFNSERFSPKYHTIRSNYPLWEKRIKEVQAGRAVIELFYWSGNPYNSPQVVFATLDKDSGCGIQELRFFPNGVGNIFHDNGDAPCAVMPSELAKNDGLTPDDFKDWFKCYDLSKPMAIVQFTNYRY